jgi:5-formyltetrahydrofolate cyclo-ligase
MIHREKQILRAQMKAALREFSEKSAASAALQEHLRGSSLWSAARVIYGFASLASEPDWIGTDWPVDKVLAFPRTSPSGLAFFIGRELLSGPFGAPEPVGSIPAPPPDLVLVPGLAFDRAGHRLGRGGGFYDRFLETLPSPRPTLCGVCFSCQIVPAVPREAHDARVDFVLTEEGLVKATRP